jgi:hypothetical protein
MTRKEARRATVAFVNEVRANQGRPPLQNLPPGTPGDSNACPIAKATGLACDGSAVYPEGTESVLDDPVCFLPEAVEFFTTNFDNGKYPDLIQEDR